MTKNTKKLICLIVAISMAVVSVVLMIVASVKTSKYGKNDYSQNIAIKEISLNQEQCDSSVRLLCHDVVINGQIRNDSKQDYLVANIEIVFAGVNNTTGEYMEFTYIQEIRDFNSGVNHDIINEKITIMSRDGYIPESIKEVRLVVNGESRVIPFEDTDETNLVLFALSLALLFVAGFMFAKWNSMRNAVALGTERLKSSEETKEENLNNGE